MKRICPRCKQELEISEFYKDNFTSHKHTIYCKNCWRLRYRENRIKHRESFHKRDKRYYQIHKKEILEKQRLRNQRDKNKNKARQAVKTALLKGILIRPIVCSMCHREKQIDAHHPDYSKPLEVQWLCRECHMRVDFGK